MSICRPVETSLLRSISSAGNILSSPSSFHIMSTLSYSTNCFVDWTKPLRTPAFVASVSCVLYSSTTISLGGASVNTSA